MKLAKHPRTAGFTLIEILVTIGIAGILMAIAVPGFYRVLPGIRVASAARQVATDLQLARIRAISQHAAQTVTFTPLTASYSFGADTRNLNQLFPGTTMAALSNGNPTFSTVGTAADTNITLSNNGLSKTVQVTAIGRIKIP
jgi:type IV fimbrial biogenesis protein FimT